MGMDAFGVFQARQPGKWVFVERYYDPCRGVLRAWLGGGGFSKHSDPDILTISPIAACRGLPESFEPTERVRYNQDGIDREDEIGSHVGEVMQSWVTVDEILSTPLPPPVDGYQYEDVTDFFGTARRMVTAHALVRFVYGFA